MPKQETEQRSVASTKPGGSGKTLTSQRKAAKAEAKKKVSNRIQKPTSWRGLGNVAVVDGKIKVNMGTGPNAAKNQIHITGRKRKTVTQDVAVVPENNNNAPTLNPSRKSKEKVKSNKSGRLSKYKDVPEKNVDLILGTDETASLSHTIDGPNEDDYFSTNIRDPSSYVIAGREHVTVRFEKIDLPKSTAYPQGTRRVVEDGPEVACYARHVACMESRINTPIPFDKVYERSTGCGKYVLESIASSYAKNHSGPVDMLTLLEHLSPGWIFMIKNYETGWSLITNTAKGVSVETLMKSKFLILTLNYSGYHVATAKNMHVSEVVDFKLFESKSYRVMVPNVIPGVSLCNKNIGSADFAVRHGLKPADATQICQVYGKLLKELVKRDKNKVEECAFMQWMGLKDGSWFTKMYFGEDVFSTLYLQPRSSTLVALRRHINPCYYTPDLSYLTKTGEHVKLRDLASQYAKDMGFEFKNGWMKDQAGGLVECVQPSDVIAEAERNAYVIANIIGLYGQTRINWQHKNAKLTFSNIIASGYTFISTTAKLPASRNVIFKPGKTCKVDDIDFRAVGLVWEEDILVKPSPPPKIEVTEPSKPKVDEKTEPAKPQEFPTPPSPSPTVEPANLSSALNELSVSIVNQFSAVVTQIVEWLKTEGVEKLKEFGKMILELIFALRGGDKRLISQKTRNMKCVCGQLGHKYIVGREVIIRCKTCVDPKVIQCDLCGALDVGLCHTCECQNEVHAHNLEMLVRTQPRYYTGCNLDDRDILEAKGITNPDKIKFEHSFEVVPAGEVKVDSVKPNASSAGAKVMKNEEVAKKEEIPRKPPTKPLPPVPNVLKVASANNPTLTDTSEKETPKCETKTEKIDDEAYKSLKKVTVEFDVDTTTEPAVLNALIGIKTEEIESATNDVVEPTPMTTGSQEMVECAETVATGLIAMANTTPTSTGCQEMEAQNSVSDNIVITETTPETTGTNEMVIDEQQEANSQTAHNGEVATATVHVHPEATEAGQPTETTGSVSPKAPVSVKESAISLSEKKTESPVKEDPVSVGGSDVVAVKVEKPESKPAVKPSSYASAVVKPPTLTAVWETEWFPANNGQNNTCYTEPVTDIKVAIRAVLSGLSGVFKRAVGEEQYTLYYKITKYDPTQVTTSIDRRKYVTDVKLKMPHVTLRCYKIQVCFGSIHRNGKTVFEQHMSKQLWVCEEYMEQLLSANLLLNNPNGARIENTVKSFSDDRAYTPYNINHEEVMSTKELSTVLSFYKTYTSSLKRVHNVVPT